MENCCLEELLECYPELKAIRKEIWDAYQCMVKCFETGHKLLIAGNGGSAADSDHIVGELMKGFVKRRPVSAKLAKALKQTDPERGAELAKKLQGGLPLDVMKKLAALLQSSPVVSHLLAGLIGLIPNCAASVIITELYLGKMITLGSMMSGLLVGAGVGLLVLYRVNGNRKENIRITVLLYVIGVIAGAAIDFLGISI